MRVYGSIVTRCREGKITKAELQFVFLPPDLPSMDRTSGVPRGFGGLTLPPRNSEVLVKLSRIPSSVENTFVAA
jgi:hypothetical protein